jgi:glycosyltransferase involved in cell wall biosynthesis
MTPPALISAIIPIYNTATYIGQMLDSLLAQSHPAIEIILVDDGSTDDLETALAPYREKITHFIRQSNQGISAARNQGMALAKGDYWIFLDSDDWLPDPSSLADMVASLEAHPEVAAVTGGWQKYYSPDKTEDYRHWELYPQLSPYVMIERFPTLLPATLLRREAALGVGEFQVDLSQAEDLDWLLRFCWGGYHIIWLPRIVYSYRQHPQSVTKRAKTEGDLSAFDYWQKIRQRPDWPPDFLRGQEQTFLYYKFVWLATQAFAEGETDFCKRILWQALPLQDSIPALRQLMNLCQEFDTHLPQGYDAPYLARFLLDTFQLPAKTPLPLKGIPLQALMQWWLQVWPGLLKGQQKPITEDTAQVEFSLFIYPPLFYPQAERALELLEQLGEKGAFANVVFWRALHNRDYSILRALLPRLAPLQLLTSLYKVLMFRHHLQAIKLEAPK